MDKKLQDKLYKKYNSIFKDRTRSIQESCMPWGICTGNGWYNLIDALCATLENVEHNYQGIKVVASQVKEKYGGLRFYYNIEGTCNSKEKINRAHGLIDGAVRLAESLSNKTCEECGSPATVRTKGWIVNLCKSCYKIRIEEHKKQLKKVKVLLKKEKAEK